VIRAFNIVKADIMESSFCVIVVSVLAVTEDVVERRLVLDFVDWIVEAEAAECSDGDCER
jgi:hypothetical protein